MTKNLMIAPAPVNAAKQNTGLLLAVVVSGLGWYFGNGLIGNYWYLIWLAPVPLLINLFYRSQRASFWLAFGACLIGRLSWFAYLDTVVSFWPALLLTLALPYAFARILVWSGQITCILDAWYTVFAYPVLMTAFEFLVLTFSPDGTATSMAYSQADVLPLIQIAALTGTLGITFLVSFSPAFIAFCWLGYYRKKHWLPYLMGSALLVFGVSFLYGFYRLGNSVPGAGARVGLVVLDEKMHHKARQATLQQVEGVIEAYSKSIAQVARRGAVIVLLPETAVRLTPENRQPVMALLRRTARQTSVHIIIGLADYSRAEARNVALVISPQGNVVADYTKNHLVGGFERQFTPGHQIGLFTLSAARAGVAICKDLDFPGHIRRYGQEKTAILFVPANDFVVDDWLHSRMAILRGVENGFPVVRTARQGRLTISDPFGRVLYEANSSEGARTLLSGTVPPVHEPTLYTRTGNWFGWLNLAVAAYLLWRTRAKNKDRTSTGKGAEGPFQTGCTGPDKIAKNRVRWPDPERGRRNG